MRRWRCSWRLPPAPAAVWDAQGQPSGKYYYQTHVLVSDAAQIQLR